MASFENGSHLGVFAFTPTSRHSKGGGSDTPVEYPHDRDIRTGGTKDDIQIRKEALTRIAECTRNRCIHDCKDILSEWGEIQQTTVDLEPNVWADAYSGALPEKCFQILLTNSDGQMTGLVFSVKTITEIGFSVDTYMYRFVLNPYFREKKQPPSFHFDLHTVENPRRLFASAASEPDYSIPCPLKHVMEFLVTSFMYNNIPTIKYLFSVDSDYEGSTSTKQIFVYKPRGWLYWAKYGKATMKDVSYSFETAQDVADFLKLFPAASLPAPQGVSALLALERLIDAALL